MTDGIYDMHCQLRVDDAGALWDAAAAKAMTYPDMTAQDVAEMIGPREDPEIADCLLLLLQPSIAGCEPLALDCAAGSTGGATAPQAETQQRGVRMAVEPSRPPSYLHTWKARGAAEFSRALRIAE